MNFLSEPSPGSSLKILHFVNSMVVNSICRFLPSPKCLLPCLSTRFLPIHILYFALKPLSKPSFSRKSSSFAHLIAIPSYSFSNYLSVPEMANCSLISTLPFFLFSYSHMATQLHTFPTRSCW